MTTTGEKQKQVDSIPNKKDGAVPLTNDALGEQTVTTYVTVPPDGGWGWVIVAASFCCNFFVDGMVYSAGVFLPDIAKTFNTTEAAVAFVGSLLSGFYLIAGRPIFLCKIILTILYQIFHLYFILRIKFVCFVLCSVVLLVAVT